MGIATLQPGSGHGTELQLLRGALPRATHAAWFAQLAEFLSVLSKLLLCTKKTTLPTGTYPYKDCVSNKMRGPICHTVHMAV